MPLVLWEGFEAKAVKDYERDTKKSIKDEKSRRKMIDKLIGLQKKYAGTNAVVRIQEKILELGGP